MRNDNRETCTCHACIKANDIQGGDDLPLNYSRMIVCPKCGNKRCPKADNHLHACSGSNAVGQQPVMDNRETLGGLVFGLILLLFVFVVLFARDCFGAELTAKVNDDGLAVVTADADGKWLVETVRKGQITAVEYFAGVNGIAFTGPAGNYRVLHLSDDGFATANVVIGGEQPSPPPDGDDDLGERPLSLPGFRVLIVYESEADRPRTQDEIIYGAEVRKFLSENCVLEDDGKTRAYRIFDQHIDTEHAAKVWQEGMQRERKSVPWCIVSNGKRAYDGPLPETVGEFLSICGGLLK